ncbi:YfmQ family protein [Ureibacillus manganicus]|uniref:Uncharacterized protein n=1 Tax=Ureibacillus manganicus DSM 26584 TaxID=1384049 RepID=A0A0A3I5P7_9BACL|nr:YfmQ family protein [Ureibacillus manganicus]KGR78018.1 hypothetical protein CD29_12740 [Ureibacillus manganicus DSM 26584]
MTWWAVLFIIFGILIKFAMSPPSAVVGWVVSKFALHPKLDATNVIVTYNGVQLEEDEKNKITDYFNEALFLERNHIFPGTENSFLNPDTEVAPFVVSVKRNNKEMKFFLYCSKTQVDVVKQWKKKVASYCLSSENLQKFAVSSSISI